MNKKYSLPQMDHRFHYEATGEESKINWVGDFLYRRPTLRERAMIDVMRTRLNGDLVTLDTDTQYYNEAIAHLRFTLKEYPDWWKDTDYGANFYDSNVIIELYDKCLEFEATWRKKTFSEDEKGVKDELEPSEESARQTEGPAANQ